VPWEYLVNEYRVDPEIAVQRAIHHAKEKFTIAADAFYDANSAISESCHEVTGAG
jgi:hypothetical protein